VSREYYGQLKSQANMLADHVRTSTYQRAILENISDFKDKVVLDVGTGSGKVVCIYKKKKENLLTPFYFKESLRFLLLKQEQNESTQSKQAR